MREEPIKQASPGVIEKSANGVKATVSVYVGWKCPVDPVWRLVGALCVADNDQ